MKVLLVTGGAGFIGSNFIKYFLRRNKNFIVVNIDRLTSASNIDSLRELEDSPRYHFIKGDICNYELTNYILKRFKPDYIINFAAETRMQNPSEHMLHYTQTNITGPLVLLESARHIWSKNAYDANRFIHISTDKVYGSMNNNSDFLVEESLLMPETPFAASKASADLMLSSYAKANNIPLIITRSCSNYGPYQSKDSAIPLYIRNALQGNPISVNTDHSINREWIYVIDNCISIIRTLFYGKPGEIYNVGSGETSSEAEIASKVLYLLGKPQEMLSIEGKNKAIDRHQLLNSYKIRNNLNWSSKISLENGLKETIYWYKTNQGVWNKDNSDDN